MRGTRLWKSVLMHMLCTPESSVQSTPKTWTTPHAPHGEFLKLCALVHARARVVEAPASDSTQPSIAPRAPSEEPLRPVAMADEHMAPVEGGANGRAS